jgi:hypothetical protein
MLSSEGIANTLMRWVYYYVGLLLVLVVVSTYALSHPAAHVEVLKGIFTAVPILTAIGQALAKANLSFYLFTQRLWLRLNAPEPTIWRFGVRFSTPPIDEPLKQALATLTALPQWHPQVVSKGDREFRLIVDKTIHLRVSIDSAAYSEDGRDYYLIQSDALEITFGQVQRKLDKVIHPLLRSLLSSMRIVDAATFMDVEFTKKNPFFAFFVARIDEDQISNFNLIFRPSSSSRDTKNKVVVTQRTMQVSASTPEDFARLAKTFLLLSSDAAEYARG